MTVMDGRRAEDPSAEGRSWGPTGGVLRSGTGVLPHSSQEVLAVIRNIELLGLLEREARSSSSQRHIWSGSQSSS